MSIADGPGLGYAVRTFNRPDQRLVLRRESVHLRPDDEDIVASVLNFFESYTLAHPDAQLDLEALTLTGQSLGRYQVLHGAADKRIKVFIAVDPFYDM